MNINTCKLHDLGQRIGLDNITCEILNNGTLARYKAELSGTGLTSNPTIFDERSGSDGWVSLEVSALLANAAAGTIQAATLHLAPDLLVFVNSVKLLRVRTAGA